VFIVISLSTEFGNFWLLRLITLWPSDIS